MRRFQAELTSTYSGALNPAYVDFTFSSTVETTAEIASDIWAYLNLAGKYVMETGVLVTGLKVSTNISTGLNPVPFPIAEAAVWNAYAGADVPAATDWGQAMGIGAGHTSSGRGDSTSVTTKSTSGGRSGVGRHFLPFLTKDAVGFDGLIDPGYITAVQGSYGICFLGADISGGAPAYSEPLPVVWSRKAGNPSYPISSVKASAIPSRLRTRTK
jgi:hypothetical protein